MVAEGWRRAAVAAVGLVLWILPCWMKLVPTGSVWRMAASAHGQSERGFHPAPLVASLAVALVAAVSAASPQKTLTHVVTPWALVLGCRLAVQEVRSDHWTAVLVVLASFSTVMSAVHATSLRNAAPRNRERVVLAVGSLVYLVVANGVVETHCSWYAGLTSLMILWRYASHVQTGSSVPAMVIWLFGVTCDYFVSVGVTARLPMPEPILDGSAEASRWYLTSSDILLRGAEHQALLVLVIATLAGASIHVAPVERGQGESSRARDPDSHADAS